MISLRIAAAALLFLVALSVHAGEVRYIRGSLTWTNERQTVTDCESGRVYWVRVLASNPHFLLTKRVEALVSKGERNIIAEFRGDVQPGRPSFGPLYPVDGTLNVRDIVSIEKGTCIK
jgi:hypothetical protein